MQSNRTVELPAHDEALRLCLASEAPGFSVRQNLTDQRAKAAAYVVQLARQVLEEEKALRGDPQITQINAENAGAEVAGDSLPAALREAPEDPEPMTRSRRRRRRK
jgi:hypothetical protein